MKPAKIDYSLRTRLTWRPLEVQRQGTQFILGVILFFVVVGALDAGVPWPRCRVKETTQ